MVLSNLSKWEKNCKLNDIEVTCMQRQLSKWGSPGLGTEATSPQLRTERQTALKIAISDIFSFDVLLGCTNQL